MVAAAPELARNAVDYAGGGELHLGVLNEADGPPGIAPYLRRPRSGYFRFALALKDGYTTGVGFGLGQGGARRLGERIRNGLQSWRGDPRNNAVEVDVWVESELGKGLTFCVSVLLTYAGSAQVSCISELKCELDPNRVPVFTGEDNREATLAYEEFLCDSSFQMIPVHTLSKARSFSKAEPPDCTTQALENTGAMLTAEHEASHA